MMQSFIDVATKGERELILAIGSGLSSLFDSWNTGGSVEYLSQKMRFWSAFNQRGKLGVRGGAVNSHVNQTLVK